MTPQELLQADVAAAHERQRREEVLAELPVSDPGLSFLVVPEGEGVDEDRSPPLELELQNVTKIKALEPWSSKTLQK